MSSPFIPCPLQYTDIPGGGQQAIIVVANTAPTTSQNQQSPGTFWLVPEPQGAGNLYYLAGFVLGVPQWELISSGSGTVISVVGTTNQITAVTAAGVVTLTIPSAFIAPGSIAATTTVTATLGNITATNGNLVLSTAGNKLIINAATPTASSVGTTAAMIAGAATITSSAITAASKIIYSRRTLGGGAGQISITSQAGGSATLTSSDNTETSTFDYLIIN